MQHILGTGNSQCKGPVAAMTETNDKDARGLARVSRGELTEEERSGGHQAHIRSDLEGLCLLHQGNGNYWRVKINEGRNQGRQVRENICFEKPCQEMSRTRTTCWQTTER